MQQPQPRARAIVIDDDRFSRALVRRTLENHGYDVVEGDTAAAALQLAQSKPDVMVIDLYLPDMSGLMVCREISSRAATLPIVFLTEADDEKNIVACLESGASDYVTKPFIPAVFIARVDAAVRTHKAELARRQHTAELTVAHAALAEARAEMVLQHRLTGLGVLAAGVAHEMNSPLSALIASLQFATHEKGVEQDAAIADALTAALRIAELVKRMGAIAGSRARSVRSIDLRMRVEQIGRALQGTHDLRVVEGPAVNIEGVDDEVREILTALIENAIQATQDVVPARIEINLSSDSESAIVIIDDNGPGIDDSDLPFVFDPFFTRKRVWQTTGLGLAIAQAAARRHGGEITLTARGPLGGVRVQMRLPLGPGISSASSVWLRDGIQFVAAALLVSPLES